MTKNLHVINDVHIGVIRGGTTPATALALRQATLDRFGDLLGWCNGSDILINGDLFDQGNIPYTDMWRTVELVSDYIRKWGDVMVFCPAGNHDLTKNTTLMSSFQIFCAFMSRMHPANFVSIFEPYSSKQHDMHIIPHLPNQALFDEALKKVPKCKHLFLHCNYDNKFAEEKDHSLNLSPEQAEKLPVDAIIIGHEHQRSSHMAGKVIAVGNMIPTSVADCLGNDAKYMLKVLSDKLEFIPTWKADNDFAQPDWKELSKLLVNEIDGSYFGPRFIRVVGEATAAEASQVVAAISKFRSKSQAFVVTNAVAIDGVRGDEDIHLSLESVKSFDVFKEIMALLTPAEAALINSLVGKHSVSTASAD